MGKAYHQQKGDFLQLHAQPVKKHHEDTGADLRPERRREERRQGHGQLYDIGLGQVLVHVQGQSTASSEFVRQRTEPEPFRVHGHEQRQNGQTCMAVQAQVPHEVREQSVEQVGRRIQSAHLQRHSQRSLSAVPGQGCRTCGRDTEQKSVRVCKALHRTCAKSGPQERQERESRFVLHDDLRGRPQGEHLHLRRNHPAVLHRNADGIDGMPCRRQLARRRNIQV